MTEEQVRYMTKGPEKKDVTFDDVISIIDRWVRFLREREGMMLRLFQIPKNQNEYSEWFIRDLEIVRGYICDHKAKPVAFELADKRTEPNEDGNDTRKALVIQYNGILSAEEREQMRTAMKQDMDQYGFIVIDNRYTLYEVEVGKGE